MNSTFGSSTGHQVRVIMEGRLCVVLLITLLGADGATIPGQATNSTIRMALQLPMTGGWAAGQASASGMILGIEEVKRRGLLPGYSFEWTWRDTTCKEKPGFKAALEMWQISEDLDVYIGGGCSVSCEPSGLLAAALNLAYVSWGCNSHKLTDKNVYPTTFRSVGPWTSLASLYVRLTDTFNWDHIAILTSTQPIFQNLAERVKVELDQANKTLVYHTVRPLNSPDDQVGIDNFAHVLENIKKKARIVFIFLYDNVEMQWCLIKMTELGMMNGEYQVVTMENHISRLQYLDHNVEEINAGYEGMLNVFLPSPSGEAWELFAADVLEAFDDPHFYGHQTLTSESSISEVDPHAGFLHDAVVLWAMAANMTLEQGGSLDDGASVTRSSLGIRFDGITGTVAMDSNGDRLSNYDVITFQNHEEVKLFEWHAVDKILEKTYKPDDPDDWSGITWTGQSPTIIVDEPECGFNNERCQVTSESNNITVIAIGALGGILLLAIPILFIVRRRVIHNKQIMILQQYMISPDEVDFACEVRSQMSLASQISKKSSQGTTVKLINQDKLVTVNILKGSIRNQQQLVKDIMDLLHSSHANLNTFYGICSLRGNIYLMYDFSKRGTLCELLENQNQSLDADFRQSFAMDIATGMTYLHSSLIGYHGNLSSMSCIVDNRWTCKISSYGFPSLSDLPSIIEDPFLKLWQAPELLKNGHKIKSDASRMRQADVYSFAIILYELWVSTDLYNISESNTVQLGEVLEQICLTRRPEIPENEIARDKSDLIRSCWKQNSLARPKFAEVRKHLFHMNANEEVSIVNRILTRLERHTENLEKTVDERTVDLSLEKRKAEDLLHSILPPSIARQIQLEGKVEPETYEGATILFSDIVGFTSLASRSTPMQVVNMLNSMYTKLDATTDKFDVYKVETIGDAYMVVSGLPLRNQDRHASEVASFSLHMLPAMEEVLIPHLPGEKIHLRVGIHTGRCVTGVVGIKMPRYCLFGDTVLVASRMESSSVSNYIHISPTTARYLKADKKFNLKAREVMEIKGLGNVLTYWLLP